ncbi:MAG: PIN domain-containing protein [Pseudomonadota bacterium]
MSAESRFFDTNVVLYLLSAETAKADRAEALLSEGGTISVQVLNVAASVMRRKLGMDWDDILDVLDCVKHVLDVRPLTLEVHERGLAIARETGFGVCDSLIVAAAAEVGAGILYTENMQAGRTVHGVKLVNPFA